jgi:hypothetical protein
MYICMSVAGADSNADDYTEDDDSDCITEATQTTRVRGATESTSSPAPVVSPYAIVIGTLLPNLAQLVVDAEPSVRATACEALAAVTPFIHPDDHMEHVLSIALRCANDHEDEDIRMTAAALLSLLAPLLSQVSGLWRVTAILLLAKSKKSARPIWLSLCWF